MAEDPQPSHSFEAVVTHVEDLDLKFWVQPLYNPEDRKKLHIIESALGNNPRKLVKAPSKDDYVSVKLNERGWKRARLKQDIQHIAVIQLVDYGVDEQVPESALYALPYELGMDVLQEQSLACSLAGVKVHSPANRPTQANQYMKEILISRKVSVKAYSISPNTHELLVDLVTPEFPSIRQHVLLNQIGSMAPIPCAPHTKDPGTIPPKLGEKNAVIVSHINDLTDFWIQYRATEKNLSSMMTAMKNMYSSNVHSPANMINIGMLCCVQLGSDWFRAEIKQVLSTGYIMVILKDFGNIQLVTSKQIYPLEGSLIEAPFWAVRCGLHNIAPTTPTAIGNFPKQLNTWFTKYATEANAYYIAHFIRQSDDRFWIDLHDDKAGAGGEKKPTTTELLVTNKCAKRITENFTSYTGMQAQLNQMGGEMASNLAHSVSGHQQHPYASMANAGGISSVGTSQMNGHSQQSAPMTASHASMASSQQAAGGYGPASAAGYPGVASNSGFMTPSPQYISSMSQQQPYSQSNAMAQYPAQNTQYTQAAAQQQAVAQQHVVVAHQAVPQQTAVAMSAQSGPSRVPRSRTEPKGPSDVFEGPYMKPELNKMEDIAVEITRTPHDFICLLRKYFDDVDVANDLLKTSYSTSKDYSIPSAKVKQGMSCVAPFVDNDVNQYYRAKVLSINRNDAEVMFVDYGNEATVPIGELKYLPKSCSRVPISIIRCEFDNVAPTEGSTTWGEGALRAFEDFLVGDFSCHIKDPKETQDTYKVELYVSPDLSSPISEELERRGVLVRLVDNMSGSSSSRGRRGGPTNSRESDKSRHQVRDRSPPPVDRRGRDADTDRRGRDADPAERPHRGREQGKKGASPSSSAANSELIRAGFRPANISSRAFHDVRVYQPCTPSKFSCQLLQDRESLDKVVDRMQLAYDSADDDDYMDDSLPFTPCAVLVDTSWQRGYILSSSYHGCQVVLVDTQEIISVDQDQLRSLRPEFMKLPTQGVKCSLEGILSKTTKWSSEACRFFKEKVSECDSNMVAEFRGDKNGVYKILLMSSELMVNAMLVHNGWAKATDQAVSDAAQELASAKRDRVFEICDVKMGSSHEVSPCYVVGPGEFYLQLVQKRSEIEELQVKINNYYNSPQATDKAKFNVDSYCAALWEDEWYRARITAVTRDECEVYFLDYGNNDVIPAADIKGLSKQFKQYPMYAIKCTCEGIDPNMMEAMTELFKELVDSEEEDDTHFHATFIKEEQKKWLVSMYEGNAPLVQKMFQKYYSGGVNISRSKMSSGSSRAVPSLPAVDLPKKDLVMISHARDPMLIYLHCERNGETESTITQISDKLQQVYGRANMPPLRIKQIGEMCAVQFSEDSLWYRGQIIAVHGDQVQVLFIDYGNEENKRGNEVFELDRELRNVAMQTSPSQLASIAEPPNGWADAAKEINILCEMKFSMTVVDPKSNPPTVELYDANTGTSLSSELIKSGYAIYNTGQCIANPQLPSIDGGSFNATIAYVSYPGRMHINKVSENPKLEDLMEKLNMEYEKLADSSNLPRLQVQPTIGTVCCTKYQDDDMYYRATVYGITRSSIKIQFTDYGNCEDKNVSDLYQLKDEYVGLPAQAIECSLNGCTISSTEWTKQMQHFIEVHVENKTYNCQVVGKENEGYSITLHDSSTGNSLTDDVNRFISSGGASAQGITNSGAPSLNSFGGSTAPVQSGPVPVAAPAKTDEVVKIEWPPRIDKFEHVAAIISYGDSPEEFWVNLVDRDNKFLQLHDKMQEVYNDGGRPVQRIFRYMYIAVKSPEFSEIYRAKTLNSDRDSPLVTYVDYGNEEEVPRDNLYILENYLATVLPCQAVRCALDGVDRLKPEGELRQELKDKFEELLNDKEIMIKNISPAQKEKPHNEVEILVNGEPVIDILEKELIALSGPPDVPVCTVEVGTVVKGAIVNITSSTHLWVQLAGNAAKINAATKVCTDNMTESPEVGTYCAVVLEEDDDTVYRAKVESVEGSNVTVTCIDYGYHRTLPMKSVYKLKQSCGEEAAQAFPCTLPLEVLPDCEQNVMEVIKTLSEKCVTVKLLSKQDDARFTVDFHPTDHLSLFVTTSLATSTLPSLAEVAGVYTFQTPDPDSTYYISHINDLSSFYVQKSDLDQDELALSVSTACSGTLQAVSCPSRGTPCVAKDSTFQAWNRAIVTDILENDMIQLLFLDYGSIEKVKRGTVKELPDNLKSLSVSAIKCCLSPLPEKYSEFTELFTTITADKELSVAQVEEDGVTVSMDGDSLTEVFSKATHYSTLSYIQPELQEITNVYCTSLEDPFNVWVQLAVYEEMLRTLMEALTEYCPEAPTLYTYTTGMVCTAKFPVDEQWYRAEITKQGADKCTVKFVDYGNSCEVARTDLKLLPEEHLSLPVNSVLVRLGDVRPLAGNKWDAAAIDKLFELTDSVLCEMRLTSYRAVQHVTLSVEGVDVATSMGEQGIAQHVPDPEILTIPQLSHQGGETSMFVTHVEQVNEIYGQLNENTEAIEGLAEVSQDGLVAVDQLFKPLHCWAEWEEALYRAAILDFNDDQADVWFVDYGNKGKVLASDVWYLTEDHLKSPAQAICLQLDGVKPLIGSEWSTGAKDVINTLVIEKSVIVTLPADFTNTVTSDVTEDRVVTSIVLEEEEGKEGVNVAESLKSSKVARSLIQPPVVSEYCTHEFSEETPVYCTEVNIPVEEETSHVIVTCQLAGTKSDEIQQLLQETITAGHPDYVPESLEVGLPCTCVYTADGQWYRAKITDVQGDNVTVIFVDYGNSQVCKSSAIQLLPEQFSAPTQLVTVPLAESDKMSTVDKNFLQKMMVVDEELIMIPTGDEEGAPAHFVILSLDENGEEASRLDAVQATIAHSTSVGRYHTFPLLEPGSVVYACQIDSVDGIFVQQDDGALDAIGALMSAHTEKVKTTDPFVGQPVLAVFEGDLYRAIVLEIVGDKFKVRFIDYGNCSVVSEVYDVTPEEVATPPQAIRLSLEQCTLTPGKTASDAATLLSSFMPPDKDVVIVAADQTPKTVLEVVPASLSVDETNVRLKLLLAGIVMDADDSIGEYEKITIPTKPVEVYISHTENENLFFGCRNGGEVVELDEDDEPLSPSDDDTFVNVDEFVESMQAVLEDEGAAPPVLDEVTPGTLCVAKWQDAHFRAVVIWVTHDYCKIRFIDYGNTHYCPLSAIMDCPEPYRGPALAVPFTGKLVDGTPVSAECKYVVEMTGEDEKSVTVSIPPPQLRKYKYTKPELNTELTGYVSYVLPHGQFYVQTEEGGDVLETTLAPLISAAANAKTPVPNLVTDAPVVGLFENSYYRGKVVEVVKPGVAKVLFVDYGNTETCSSMFDTTDDLIALRVVGINCKLEGVDWIGVEAKPTFDGKIELDAALTLTPTSYNKDRKQYTVKAIAGEEGSEVDVNAAVIGATVSEKALPDPLNRHFPTNTFLKFYCSKINSVQDVCLQVEEDSELLDTIANEAAVCLKIPLLAALPGTVCLALDPADNASYCRARVLSDCDTTQLYTVHFVDYGNKETLPLTSLFDIPVGLTQHKICGIQCKVANTTLPENGFDAANLATLQQLLDPNTELSVCILPAADSNTDSCLSINVVVGAKPLRDVIQVEALSEVPKKFDYPRFEGQQPLLISVTNDPTDFYAQRESDGTHLDTLFTLITEKTVTDVPLENPKVGDVCVALSPSDEALYRGVVVSNTEEEGGVTVRYVDYGNTEQVTTLYQIHPTLLSIPVLALPLSLPSISTPSTPWSEECLTTLTSLIPENTSITVTPLTWRESEGVGVKCEAEVILQSGTSLKVMMVEHVENTDPDWSVEEARATAEAVPATQAEKEQSPIATGPTFTYQKIDAPATLYVSVVNGPDDFYLQKEEWAADLGALQEQVAACQMTVMSNPAPGMLCLASSLELEDTYRAEVLSVGSDGVLVRYVDYGNQETLPLKNVFTLPDNMSQAPVYTVPCTLSGDSWSQQAKDTFLGIVIPDNSVVLTPISWSEGPRFVCTCSLQLEDGSDAATAIAV